MEVYLSAWLCRFEFIDASEDEVSSLAQTDLCPGSASCPMIMLKSTFYPEYVSLNLAASECEMWGIGCEVSRRPRQIYVLHLGKCWKISENISTNPRKLGQPWMQPVQEGPRRILSQEHIPDTREMLDKIRHQTLRENCKLPINILH